MEMAKIEEWMLQRKGKSVDLLQTWCAINSWTQNRQGLAMMLEAIKEAFACLPFTVEEIDLPTWKQWDDKGAVVEVELGKALLFRKQTKASKKVLLGGHMDTVYPPYSTFQTTTREGSILKGPGVADMKGGIVTLLLALEAFEHFKEDSDLSWEVLISPDEEVGSPGSRLHWEKAASRAHLGLVFEPSFSDGALVDRRKGSATYTVIVQGKAAHAGRDFHLGISAVKALAEFIVKAYAAAGEYSGMSLNVANVKSSEVLNIVAADSSCRLNMRSFDPLHLQQLQKMLYEIAQKIALQAGVRIELLLESDRSPKLFEGKTVNLYKRFEQCAEEMGLKISLRPSGGLSDGNILASCHLPTIDSLGVIGGNLHTEDEYMLLDSLPERAQLTTQFLLRYAQGQFPELELR